MNISKFWSRIKGLLKEKGITQGDAAKACNVPVNTLRHWMTKEYYPPLNYVASLARFLGVSIEYLVYGKEREKSSILKNIYTQLENLKNDIDELKKNR